MIYEDLTSIAAGQWECKAAGHIVSTLRHPKEKHVDTWCAFLYLPLKILIFTADENY